MDDLTRLQMVTDPVGPCRTNCSNLALVLTMRRHCRSAMACSLRLLGRLWMSLGLPAPNQPESAMIERGKPNRNLDPSSWMIYSNLWTRRGAHARH